MRLGKGKNRKAIEVESLREEERGRRKEKGIEKARELV